MLQRGIKLEPAHGGCFSTLGDLRARQGDITAAEAAYRKAVSLEPTMTLFWLELGLLLENKGDKRGAETVYRKALQAIPDFSSSYSSYCVNLEKTLVSEFPSLRKLIGP